MACNYRRVRRKKNQRQISRKFCILDLLGIIMVMDGIVREEENVLMIEFHRVIEEIKLLNLEDKIYLKDLLDRMLIEEKRKRIKKMLRKA